MQVFELFKKVLCEGVQKNTITYNTAIGACEGGRQRQQALGLPKGMPGRGEQRDTITYSSTISACEKSDWLSSRYIKPLPGVTAQQTIRTVDKTVPMSSAMDENLLKATSEAHHEAIDSIDGQEVTSAADYEAVYAAIGRIVASMSTFKTVNDYNAWADLLSGKVPNNLFSTMNPIDVNTAGNDSGESAPLATLRGKAAVTPLHHELAQEGWSETAFASLRASVQSFRRPNGTREGGVEISGRNMKFPGLIPLPPLRPRLVKRSLCIPDRFIRQMSRSSHPEHVLNSLWLRLHPNRTATKRVSSAHHGTRLGQLVYLSLQLLLLSKPVTTGYQP